MTEAEIIIGILHISTEQQNQLLRFFIRLDVDKKLNILRMQRDGFYALKQANKEVEVSILTYCSLILAIQKQCKSLSALDKNVITINAKKISKSYKKDKLIGYWAVIKELKNTKKQSFRQIAEYLKKYHKLEVAHSTLYKLWGELEIIKNQQNGEKQNG